MSIIKQPSAKKSNTNIILDYLEKFPNAPSRTIAKKIYNENSAFFRDAENVYFRVRYYRGQTGSINRDKLKKLRKFIIVGSNRIERREERSKYGTYCRSKHTRQ